jgi:RimJ/RimL family protein N-acetyltransferase
MQSGEPVRLRDGTKAVILPFRPVPRAAIEKAYDELSPESRFHRFLSSAPHLTDSMFHHLVEEVDGVDHIALLLVLEPDEGPESIIGVARIIRYQEEPTSADVAVTIRDKWHGQGAATALLAALMRQRPAGVTRIVTVVSADNIAGLAMLRRLGPCVVTPAGHGTVKVVVDPLATTDSPP